MWRPLLWRLAVLMNVVAHPALATNKDQIAVAHKVLRDLKSKQVGVEAFSQIDDHSTLLATKFLLILDAPHLATIEDVLDIAHQAPELRSKLRKRPDAVIKVLLHNNASADAILEIVSKLELIERLSGDDALSLLSMLKNKGAAEYIIDEYTNQLWRSVKFNDTQWRQFIASYGGRIQEDSHIVNIKKLFLQKRFTLVRVALSYLQNPVALRRIKLALGVVEHGGLLSRSLGDFEEIALLTAPQMFKQNTLQSRYDLVTRCMATNDYANLWWPHYRILINDLLRSRHLEQAYQLASNVRLNFTGDLRFLQQTMAGWIACRMGHYQRAIIHLLEAESLATLHGSKAKVYYWLARSYEAIHNKDFAQYYYAKAAMYPLSFYGQLAAEVRGIDVHALIKQKVGSCSSCDIDSCKRFHSKNFLVGLILEKGNSINRALQHFSDSFTDDVNDTEKCCILNYVGKKFGTRYVAYDIALRAVNFSVANTDISYPSLKDLGSPLVWALIRKESRFRGSAVSPKNAQGLMQLLEQTACNVASTLGVPYNKQRLLKDSKYNVFIGSAYLNTLLKRYDGNMMAAVASYNAGLTRVDRWLKDNPLVNASDHLQVTHWVEALPYRETYDYVIKVLEAKTVYDALTKS